MFNFIVLAVIIALILKRNPLTILDINFKYPALLIFPFIIQLILYIVFELNPTKYYWLLEITMLILCYGLYVNRQYKGLLIIAFGACINIISVLIHGGSMPVLKKSAEIAGVAFTEDQRHVYFSKGVWWLTDWIPSYHTVLSIGDVFVVIGITIFIITHSKKYKVKES